MKAGLLVFLLAMTLSKGAVAGDLLAEHRLDNNGFRYTFVQMPNTDNAEDVDAYGIITISDIRTGMTILTEKTALLPGCNSISPLFLINAARDAENYTAVGLCGSLGGRHYTIKIYARVAGGFSIAALDFYDTEPNLSADSASGPLFAKLSRPILRRDISPSLQFPQAYKLMSDFSTVAFVPVFKEAAGFYAKYYSALISSDPRREFVGPAIAALIAVEDASFICGELAELRRENVPSIAEWVNELTAAGYPAFDISRCEAK
jgi:hypothetical protein